MLYTDETGKRHIFASSTHTGRISGGGGVGMASGKKAIKQANKLNKQGLLAEWEYYQLHVNDKAVIARLKAIQRANHPDLNAHANLDEYARATRLLKQVRGR